MSARRPYVRPVAGWWRRNPFFVRYMAREVTALFVWLYALVLLVGLVRLAEGRQAWEGWVEALRQPASIALHLVFLAVFAYHTWSWFVIMPKTMPPVVVGGKRLAAQTVTAMGLAASVVASVVMLALFVGLAA